jgi:tetratricopeptide (TPR) repeat protein
LSYSHADRTWAAWLHRALEAYSVPSHLVARGAPRHLRPVFRDREELASAADLGSKIEAALADSAALVVVCSPGAARSRWVNAEVEYFQRLGRPDRIFCIAIGGEPNAARRGLDPSLENLPPSLRAEAGFEPLAADARKGADGRRGALLKLIAGLIGVDLDVLRRRDLQRRNRRLAWLTAASIAGVILTTTLAVAALLAREEAEANAARAEREAQTAQRTAQFMVELFEVVDPGEARGRSITAYEILERGVGRIRTDLDREPAVRAVLLRTMGKVYTGLGLYPRSAELLEKALNDLHDAGAVDVMATLVALADALYLEGRYDAAESRYREALATLEPGNPWRAEASAANNGLADVLVQRQLLDDAIAIYEATLARDVTTFGATSAPAARTANGLATARLYRGDLAGAEAGYRQALDAFRASLGEDHPKVAETINNLGAVRYFSGDPQGAARLYRQALPRYRRLYGERHPEVAMILNNLGRIALERSDVATAVQLLEESVAIDRTLERSDHDDFIFALASLGLAHRNTGDLDRAQALLEEASELAAQHDHRLEGPILVDAADTLCARGHANAGLPLLARARPLVATTYPSEPWRMAVLENVLGFCMRAIGQDAAGEALMRSSTPEIVARWGDDALFSRAARARIEGG